MPDKYEGFVSLLDGMQGGVKASLLKKTQYARGVNISSRGGLIHTRPKFKFLKTLADGKFQGAAVFSLNSSDRLIIGIDGHLYDYVLESGTVTDLGLWMDPTVDRLYFAQADKYFIVQDGVSLPVIIEETTSLVDTARRAVYGVALEDTKSMSETGALSQNDSPAPSGETYDELPAGTIMAYGHGRLFVVPNVVPGTSESGKRFFIAGDVIKPYDPSELLRFTENEYWNEGGAIGLPNELGFIHGMSFLRNAQTGSGYGSLIVFARNGVAAFAVNIPRAAWKDSDLGAVLFSGVGMISPQSILSVNNDLIFRGTDGIRSLLYTAASTSGSGHLTCIPISGEIDEWLSQDGAAILPFVTQAFWDNRLLTLTMGEVQENGEVHFKGMTSIDYATITVMSAAAPAIYDGIWTGHDFLSIHTARINDSVGAFVLVKDGESNHIYTIEDGIYDGTASRPVCRLYTRIFNFDDISQLKSLRKIYLWLSSIRGQVDLKVYYRPGYFPLWAECNDFTILASTNGYAQRRSAIRFTPFEGCDEATNSILNKNTDFQLCIEWTGEAQIDKCKLEAELMTDSVRTQIEETEVVSLTGTGLTELNDFEYEA